MSQNPKVYPAKPRLLQGLASLVIERLYRFTPLPSHYFHRILKICSGINLVVYFVDETFKMSFRYCFSLCDGLFIT